MRINSPEYAEAQHEWEAFWEWVDTLPAVVSCGLSESGLRAIHARGEFRA